MPTLSELRSRPRGKGRWWIPLLIVAMIPVGLFSWNLIRGHQGEYDYVPLEILRTGDMELIREFQRESRENSDPLPFEEESGLAIGVVPESSEHLQASASAWVRAVNHYNPDAIIYHDTDPLGNLYLILGGWWLELPHRHQFGALDSLGRFWRSYLYDTYGDWSYGTRAEFAPGVILVDGEGDMFARNINGKVEFLRDPVYPTH